MGILLCEQNFRDVWIRNESVRAEIGQNLHNDTHPHTHTTAAKLVVRMYNAMAECCNTCRCCVFGCYTTEDYFLENEGIFLLIDLLQVLCSYHHLY